MMAKWDIVMQVFQPAIIAVQRIGRPHSLPYKYSLNYTCIVFAKSNGVLPLVTPAKAGVQTLS